MRTGHSSSLTYSVGAAAALLVLTLSSPARAQLMPCTPGNPATCEALFSAICWPHTCTLINAPPYISGYFCIPGTQGAVNTPCESDGNACSSDVCGNADGICHHDAAVAGGTTCGSNMTCSGLSCVCTGGYKQCGAGCIPNAACCTSGDCNNGHVCSGAGGSCVCPGGTYECGGVCIASATCCTSPNNCPPPAGGNGTGQCSGNGGSCTAVCNANYKLCGGVCIPNSQCCTNTDCPNDAANHRHGVCGGGTCAYACDASYKPCGATCIPTASCCLSAECTSPPSGCYKPAGTCTSGACSYAYNDGAACNADSNKCTPNDTCKTGACIADTAHKVVCSQRLCHTAPACNTTTGNCDDAAVADGSVCGGNGCAATVGSCTTGVCSTTPKDCSATDTACTLGACDITGAVGAPCLANNKMNGLACTLTDKCMLDTACSGGSCVGTPKVCPSSDECHVALCNSSTGACDETVAPVGTPCTGPGGCLQNAACDATGACAGQGLPDGTPCARAECDNAACVTNECICLATADLGSSAPIIPTDEPDMSASADPSKKGCSYAPGAGPATSATAMLGLGVLLAWAFAVSRRRRAPLRRPGL